MEELREEENIYLIFSMDKKIYGIETKYILRIIGIEEIFETPEAHHCIKGFISLRSSMIPVASMRMLFGIGEGEYTDKTCIIVVRENEKEIGLIIDAVEETVAIDFENNLQVYGEGVENDYIMGDVKLMSGQTASIINCGNCLRGISNSF